MKRILKSSLLLILFSSAGQLAHAVDIEAFEFNDFNGTTLENAANSVNPGRLWSVTNGGADMAPSSVESGSYRIIKDQVGLAQNRLDIDNITSGVVYLSATFSSWKFTAPSGGDAAGPEQVRLAFLNSDGVTGTEITAQVQVRRSPETDDQSPNFQRIELRGNAEGGNGAEDIQTLAPLATQQTNPFTMVLALDQESDYYEVFYKDGTNPTQVLGRASISRVRDANSIRLAVNNNLGSTNLFPVFVDEQANIDRIALSDTNPLSDLISLEIDRDTGAMKLKNTSGAAINNIESYSITSAVGGLDSAQWKTVTGNYDNSPGNGSFDNNDFWTITSSSSSELSEAMQTGNGAPEDGGSLFIGQNVVLDISPLSTPGAWIRNPTEDVHMVLNLAGGITRTVDVNFVGNGGARWEIADLNFDGDIDVDDWTIFSSHAETDLSSLSVAEAYQRGDLDGDGVNSFLDFVIFKDVYNASNPLISFEAMIAGVPEPSTLTFVLVAALGLSASRRKHNLFN